MKIQFRDPLLRNWKDDFYLLEYHKKHGKSVLFPKKFSSV